MALAALRRFPVRPDRVRLVQYEDNAVYAVDAGTRRWMLRVSVRDGRSPLEQEAELRWLDRIRAAGTVEVPEPVRTVDGARLCTLGDSVAALFGWVVGTPSPTVVSDGLAQQWGTATAQLHLLARPAGPFARPSWDRDTVIDRGAALTSRGTALVGADGMAVLRAAAARVGEHGGAERGLIHADLHRGNVVETPEHGLAVIDFDDCGFGPLLLDIATALSSVVRLCTHRPEHYRRFARRFLDAYRQVRPLPQPMDRFAEFLVLREFVILDFLAQSANPTVAAYGPRRAREIVEHLRRWNQGEPYPGDLDA